MNQIERKNEPKTTTVKTKISLQEPADIMSDVKSGVGDQKQCWCSAVSSCSVGTGVCGSHYSETWSKHQVQQFWTAVSIDSQRQ